MYPLTSKHSTQPKDHPLPLPAADTAAVAAAAVPNPLAAPVAPAAPTPAFQYSDYPWHQHNTRSRRNALFAADPAAGVPEAAEVGRSLEERSLLAAIAAIVHPEDSVPKGYRTSSSCKGGIGRRRFASVAERRGGGRGRC